jgi:hypothetical protein
MTKRKTNPATRGRKPVSSFTYRLLRVRWERFRQDAGEPGSSALALADAFIAKNRTWLRAHRINPGQYTSLKNDLSKGRQVRERVVSAREGKWGVVTNITGRRFLSTNAEYIRYHQARALSGISVTILGAVPDNR